jgi:hypothetical protein
LQLQAAKFLSTTEPSEYSLTEIVVSAIGSRTIADRGNGKGVLMTLAVLVEKAQTGTYR